MRSNLIIDVGMHQGEDSEFYIKKGFDVVAVEANPKLYTSAKERLASYVNSGRLKLINAAIAPEPGKVRFAVADENPVWGSLSSDFIERNRALGVKYDYVDVPAVPFDEVLREHDVPYYLKIDIEGFDMLCVRALRNLSERPKFVSIETAASANDAPFEAYFDELAELWSLGYRHFKYVQQARKNVSCPNPPREGVYVDAQFDDVCSGPFGEETPGPWLNIEQAMTRARQIARRHNFGGIGGKYSRTPVGVAYRAWQARVLKRPVGWYDLHAKLGA
jgi:FkbM family methyltransferase